MIQGLRESVRVTSREALRILDRADIWATRTGNAVRLVSANDHVHARGSAHYEGRALDFHSSNPDALARTMRLAGYRVLWKVPGHYGHIHVEAAAQAAPVKAPRNAAVVTSEGPFQSKNWKETELIRDLQHVVAAVP